MNIGNFDDGTIVIRIGRVNYTAPPLEEFFSIRTIYPNGTIKELTVIKQFCTIIILIISHFT
jgi:hypothetical protein